ncbi:hypothetical protein [Evansella halocellulosilytica]|uniref:hypothetical protein n=1 Tax=Evansella halocellulosilytica TaxID=2011013 RepID=UPI00211C5EB3|nr:hypothetical protein [Evansella halocellulosilytica]
MATFTRIAMLVISWISIIYLPKNSFKKYLPVANFAASLILITSLISVPLKLWVVENGGMKEKLSTDLSIILGPFFIGTLWIFHFTFGKFRLYVLLNVVMNFLLAYPICTILQKLKLFKLINFRPIYIFITYLIYSIFLYGYQLFLEKPKRDGI